MFNGIQSNQAISLTYNWATLSTPQVSQISRKWADLVSQPTTIQMAFLVEAERGNPMMKSIEIEPYFQVGIFKGCRDVDTQL